MRQLRLVSVKPIQGYGWTDGEKSIETPQPFEALVEQHGAELSGQVRDGIFQEGQLLLSKRHEVWDGLVNVAIRLPKGAGAYGFGEIPIECLI